MLKNRWYAIGEHTDVILMLIEFRFKNYRSFRNKAVLSMEATGLSSFKSCLIPLSSTVKLLPAIFAALTYCGSKNKFPSIEESCRKDSCPLFPFRRGENALCVTCIETVFRNAADAVKNIFDEQSETE